MVSDTAHLSEKPSGSLICQVSEISFFPATSQTGPLSTSASFSSPSNFPPAFSRPHNISFKFLVDSTHGERPTHVAFRPKRNHHACSIHNAWRTESDQFYTQICIGSLQDSHTLSFSLPDWVLRTSCLVKQIETVGQLVSLGVLLAGHGNGLTITLSVYLGQFGVVQLGKCQWGSFLSSHGPSIHLVSLELRSDAYHR